MKPNDAGTPHVSRSRLFYPYHSQAGRLQSPFHAQIGISFVFTYFTIKENLLPSLILQHTQTSSRAAKLYTQTIMSPLMNALSRAQNQWRTHVHLLIVVQKLGCIGIVDVRKCEQQTSFDWVISFAIRRGLIHAISHPYLY